MSHPEALMKAISRALAEHLDDYGQELPEDERECCARVVLDLFDVREERRVIKVPGYPPHDGNPNFDQIIGRRRRFVLTTAWEAIE